MKSNLSKLSIVFSLPQEQKPFIKLFHQIPDSLDIWVCGAGPVASSDAFVRHFTSCQTPECILFCGFAGGLSDLTIGDIVLAKSVYNLYSANSISILHGSQYLLDKALQVHLPSVQSSEKILMSTSEVLLNRTMKEYNNSLINFAADCVDMETAALAFHANSLAIPWLAIRVITDGIENSMPLDFNSLTDKSGKLSMPALFYEICRQPKSIPGLISLGKHSSLAGKNLSNFLYHFLSLMELL